MIVEGDHGQDEFRFPMKLLFVMKSEKNVERTSSVAYILYKEDNGDTLKYTIIDQIQEPFKFMLDPIKIDSHQVYIDHIYVTGDLAFWVILLGKEFSSPKWCFKCKLHPKVLLEHGHKIGEYWTISALRLVSESNSTNSARLSVKEVPSWEFVEVDK